MTEPEPPRVKENDGLTYVPEGQKYPDRDAMYFKSASSTTEASFSSRSLEEQVIEASEDEHEHCFVFFAYRIRMGKPVSKLLASLSLKAGAEPRDFDRPPDDDAAAAVPALSKVRATSLNQVILQRVASVRRSCS